jgi:hypothetical protein
MSLLHSQRDCWCLDGRHTMEETVMLNFDHLQTVSEAEVLGPYEEESE